MVNIKLLFLLLLSLLPSVSYLLLYRKLKQQWEARLERIRWVAQLSYLGYPANVTDSPLLEEELAVSYIGDLSCIYNARSPYLRCAVNPCGSCQDCPYYQAT